MELSFKDPNTSCFSQNLFPVIDYYCPDSSGYIFKLLHVYCDSVVILVCL